MPGVPARTGPLSTTIEEPRRKKEKMEAGQRERRREMTEGREAAQMNSNSRKFSNIWKIESFTNISAFANI